MKKTREEHTIESNINYLRSSQIPDGGTPKSLQWNFKIVTFSNQENLSANMNKETAGMYKILSLMLTLGMLCSMVHLAEAGTVTLGWNPNTETDLAGYRIHYGKSSRDQATYTQTVLINNKYATTKELTLPDGVYYFALTAFDLSGNESGFSNEVMAEVSEETSPPGQPGRPIFMLQ